MHITEYDDGLLAHYAFEEENGTVVIDSSGNNNDAQMINMDPVISRVTGKVGMALEFDGIDDYIDAGNADEFNFGTGNFSIAFWIKAPAGLFRNLIRKRSTIPDELYRMVIMRNGVLRSIIGDGITKVRSTKDGPRVDDDIWHHVVVNFDRAGYMTRYLDGQQYGSQDDISFLTGAVNPSRKLFIGGKNRKRFDGILDEFQLFDRLLNATEISDLYNE